MIAVEQSPFENITRGEWTALAQEPGPDYDWNISTEENYRSGKQDFCGAFREMRKRLDYQFHAHYTCERQRFQDSIIMSILEADARDKVTGQYCSVAPNPWVVFTAGAMGAGKSFTIRRLHARGLFPLESFVVVDPDEVRRRLPEFQGYLRKSAELAGALTRKEVGMMAEILTEAALERGQNVLKDGSLRDAEWYKQYFAELRGSIPGIQLGIIHVTAPLNVILERVRERAKETGRIVPREVLEKSVEQVPKSVHILKKYVEFFLEVDNSGKDDGSGEVIARGMEVTAVKEHFVRWYRNDELAVTNSNR